MVLKIAPQRGQAETIGRWAAEVIRSAAATCGFRASRQARIRLGFSP